MLSEIAEAGGLVVVRFVIHYESQTDHGCQVLIYLLWMKVDGSVVHQETSKGRSCLWRAGLKDIKT